ncbi:MAG: chloride channel protein [Polyangiaceae bacterium]
MIEPSNKPGASRLERARALGRVLNRWLLVAIDRATPSEQNRLFGLTLVVGAACGLAAVAFHLVIRFAEDLMLSRALALRGPASLVALVLTPALGALVAGVLLHKYAPEARGSGIPQVKWTYAARSGRLRLRDGVAKFVLSAIQIGSGSSLGREGPTVQICAAVASALGRLFALSPSNRRRLIPVGAAAGIAAAFNAPIAAVTFVIEELVGGLDTTVLSGVVVAAALAAVVEHSILGEHPIFDVPGDYRMQHATSLVVFALLGLAAGVAGHLFARGLLRLRGRFATRSRIPRWAQPAVGGLATGAVAALTLGLFGAQGVAGGGYETLTLGLHGDLPFKVMAVLCAAKFVATIFSYSSGGAGGIFAPALFVGAMLGGLFGLVDRYALGHADLQIGAFALVGMGAFFAAVIRAPITSILIIFEMTGSYRLVLPLMVANALAYRTARYFDPTPIYEALLEQDGRRVPESARSAQILATVKVGDVVVRDVITIDAAGTVDEALRVAESCSFSSFPVVRDGVLAGVLTEARLRRLVAEGSGADPVSDHARVREYLGAGQTLHEALSTMNRLGLRHLSVVDDAQHRHLVGILSMSDVVQVLLRAEQAEGPASTGTPIPASRPG